MKIKSGDSVKVIAGKLKGTASKVIRVDVKNDRVFLEDGPKLLRHLKPEKSRKHPEGGIIEKQGSVHISNVMLMAEGSDRPYRAGYVLKDGVKNRVARGKAASGNSL